MINTKSLKEIEAEEKKLMEEKKEAVCRDNIMILTEELGYSLWENHNCKCGKPFYHKVYTNEYERVCQKAICLQDQQMLEVLSYECIICNKNLYDILRTTNTGYESHNYDVMKFEYKPHLKITEKGRKLGEKEYDFGSFDVCEDCFNLKDFKTRFELYHEKESLEEANDNKERSAKEIDRINNKLNEEKKTLIKYLFEIGEHQAKITRLKERLVRH